MTERPMKIKEHSAVYKAIWKNMGFIEDEHARVRACNTIFISMEREEARKRR